MILRRFYCSNKQILIKLEIPGICECDLDFRIPPWWNEQCEFTVNSELVHPVPGRYLRLHRQWRQGDEIRLKFDFAVRRIENPGDPAYEAFMRGPIVLAATTRLPSGKFPLANEVVFENLPPEAGCHVVERASSGGYLVDYASAGNTFKAADQLQVWFPRRVPVMYVYERDRD